MMKKMVMTLSGLALLAAPAVFLTFPAAEEGGADMTGMMEAFAKHRTPGAEHEQLGFFIGSWDVKEMINMSPDMKMESVGAYTCEWAFGKRYVEGHYQGEVFGEKFNGRGLMGYNNTLKRFESFWVDDMSTSMSMTSGTYDKENKTYSFEGEMTCALEGQAVKSRTTVKVVNADSYVMSMNCTRKGKEEACCELTFTRKKK